MLLVRPDGSVAFANEQAERLLAYSREELVGLALEELVPERFRAAHQRHRAEFFDNPGVRPMGLDLELSALRKDGGRLPVEISLSSLESDEGVLVACSIRDVSERRKTEQSLHEAFSEIRRLKDRLEAENVYLRQEITEGFEEIVGESEPLKKLLRRQTTGILEYFADLATQSWRKRSALGAV